MASFISFSITMPHSSSPFKMSHTRTVYYASSEFLNPLVLILLIAVAVYTISRKDWGSESTSKRLHWKIAVLFVTAIFVISFYFYNGFLSAGTRFFYIICFFINLFRFHSICQQRQTVELRKQHHSFNDISGAFFLLVNNERRNDILCFRRFAVCCKAGCHVCTTIIYYRDYTAYWKKHI
jgi:hypothetical protein